MLGGGSRFVQTIDRESGANDERDPLAQCVSPTWSRPVIHKPWHVPSSDRRTGVEVGEVYRGKDPKLKRDVAIKILPDEFSSDYDRASRFQREAEVLATLNHANIAAVYDLQEANGSRFLVFELVEGETLADRIVRGPVPLEEALLIAKQVAEALEAAHENIKSGLSSPEVAEDHGQRAENPFHGIQHEPQRFEGDGTKKRAVTLFPKDHRGCSPMVIEQERRVTHAARDRCSIREDERPPAMWPNSQATQRRGRNDRINSAGIYKESNLGRLCWPGRIGNAHLDMRETHH